jgi:hypothetical protein
MYRFKRSEIPEILPYPLPHNSFIIVRSRTLGGGKNKTVVSSCNNL